MAYFNGVKIGDRVWDFFNKWGSVIKIDKNEITLLKEYIKNILFFGMKLTLKFLKNIK